MKNIGIRITKELKKEFKEQCCKEDIQMTDFIIQKIEEFVNQKRT